MHPDRLAWQRDGRLEPVAERHCATAGQSVRSHGPRSAEQRARFGETTLIVHALDRLPAYRNAQHLFVDLHAAPRLDDDHADIVTARSRYRGDTAPRGSSAYPFGRHRRRRCSELPCRARAALPASRLDRGRAWRADLHRFPGDLEPAASRCTARRSRPTIRIAARGRGRGRRARGSRFPGLALSAAVLLCGGGSCEPSLYRRLRRLDCADARPLRACHRHGRRPARGDCHRARGALGCWPIYWSARTGC